MEKWKENRTILWQGGLVLLVSRVPIMQMNPLAIAIFAVTYGGNALLKKWDRSILLLSSLAGIFSCMTNVDGIKYAIALLFMVTIEENIRRKGYRMGLIGFSAIGALALLLLNLSNLVVQEPTKKMLVLTILEVIIILTLPQLLQRGIRLIQYGKQGKLPQGEEFVSLMITLSIAVLGIPEVLGSQYSFRGVALYFSVLFLAYRYGAGYGAIAGAAMGVVASLQEGPEQIAIFCLIGLAAGMLRELTRFGSALIFAGTGIVLHMVWTTGATMDVQRSILSATAIFLLLPSSIRILIREVGHARGEDMLVRQNFQKATGNRIQEFAEAFQQLAGSIYNSTEVEGRIPPQLADDELGAVLTQDTAYNGNWDRIWKNQMTENRLVMADQMDEVGRILKRFADNLGEVTKFPEQMEEELRSALRRQHILVKRMTMHQGRLREIHLTMKSRHNVCVTTKEVASMISEIMHMNYVVQDGTRHVIPKEYETVTFTEDVSFHMLTGLARIAKNGERINGDTFSFLKLRGGQMMMVLSDGMGSGRSAYTESELVIGMMENLLEAGFEEESAIRFVNSILVSRGEPQSFSTLDLCMLDLHTGILRCLKNGASSTFIKRKDHVETLYGEGLPIGMFVHAEPETLKRKLYDEDIVVMVTDGILDALPGDDKEFYMENLLGNIRSNNPQEIANYILEHAIHQSGEQAIDDMSVMVAGVWEKSGGRIR